MLSINNKPITELQEFGEFLSTDQVENLAIVTAWSLQKAELLLGVETEMDDILQVAKKAMEKKDNDPPTDQEAFLASLRLAESFAPEGKFKELLSFVISAYDDGKINLMEKLSIALHAPGGFADLASQVNDSE